MSEKLQKVSYFAFFAKNPSGTQGKANHREDGNFKGAVQFAPSGRCGGLTVSALEFGSGSLGSSLWPGYCAVSLSKTLYSHSASLHPGHRVPANCWDNL